MSRKRKKPSRRHREVKLMPKLTIRVRPDGWGQVSALSIESLLQNTAAHINDHLREPVTVPISVRRTDSGPMTLPQESSPDQYCVALSAGDSYWCQYVYQFAHEFCHVMINPFVPRIGSNSWIEETLAELASLFALRRMAEQWETHTPTGHDAAFAPSFATYIQDYLSDPQRSMPVGVELPEWVSDNEPVLRSGPNLATMEQWDAEQRNRMTVVANELLPLFEQQPVSAWNAVKRLPVANLSAISLMPTSEYLQYWRSEADERDTSTVELVMRILGR